MDGGGLFELQLFNGIFCGYGPLNLIVVSGAEIAVILGPAFGVCQEGRGI